MENNIKMSSPWAVYYRQIDAMFGLDPDITIKFDENAPCIKLYVKGIKKAEAISELLPAEKVFGNVTLSIMVIPDNDNKILKLNVFKEAFKNNPVLEKVFNTKDPTGTTELNYIVFKKEVVQYYIDDLFGLFGIRSTLYQDIAKELFGNMNNVIYCTDVSEDINCPYLNNGCAIIDKFVEEELM